jgi:hypothetical protein
MSRFPGKKLPPHWVYIPSRREVGNLSRGLAADVRLEFGGTGSGPTSVGLLLGYLERRVVDRAWCFYLRLWGVPESALEGRRDGLGQAAVRVVGQSIRECLDRPANELVTPTQLLLWFAIGADGVIPNCEVEPVDQYSFSAGCWWARSSSH